MKIGMIALATAALLAFGAVSAATPAASSKAPATTKTAQQSKMSTCAAANKGKKGEDYKASMSACLKGTPAPAKTASAPVNKPAPATVPANTTRGGKDQQAKMTACASANKGKKGDAFKSAMSACMKAAPASAKHA